MMPAISDFSENSLFLWIKPEDLLCYTNEDAKQDLASGTAKVFIEPIEVKHRQDGGHFGTLFTLVLSQKDRSDHQLPYKGSSRGGTIELFLRANKLGIPIPDWS